MRFLNNVKIKYTLAAMEDARSGEKFSDYKPIEDEELYVDELTPDDEDDDNEGWGVFGEESGFCYGIFDTEKDAYEEAEKLDSYHPVSKEYQDLKQKLKDDLEAIINFIDQNSSALEIRLFNYRDDIDVDNTNDVKNIYSRIKHLLEKDK